MKRRQSRTALSFTELLSVLAIVGLLAAVVVPRVFNRSDSAKIAACQTHKGNIEIQAELWKNNTGEWPAGDLSDIGSDLSYFTDGVPNCPVDGTAYAIDIETGRVIGHNH